MKAVLLDALGTLVELERPWPHLVSELAGRGVRIGERVARDAMAAEIAYYRAHHDSAGTRAGLARVRRGCAEVVAERLGARVAGLPIADVEGALLGAIRFRAYPEVAGALAALRDEGCAVVVVSNWDVSLHGVLAELGLDALLDGVVTSAEFGASKPDPAIFARALALAGARAGEAVHAGDSVAEDIEGAQAAGVAAVLVDREGRHGGGRPCGEVDAAPVGGVRLAEALPSAGVPVGEGAPGAEVRAAAGVPAGVPIVAGLDGLAELVRYRRGPA